MWSQMNTYLFGSFMGSTQKYPLLYIITCYWCGARWIHTSLGVLWAAHRNIHCSVAVICEHWSGWHSVCKTQIQCLTFSFREKCILTRYDTLMFIPIHVYHKQCSIIKEQILNKICLWNINAPDNSHFQRWLKVINILKAVERLIVSQL